MVKVRGDLSVIGYCERMWKGVLCAVGVVSVRVHVGCVVVVVLLPAHAHN